MLKLFKFAVQEPRFIQQQKTRAEMIIDKDIMGRRIYYRAWKDGPYWKFVVTTPEITAEHKASVNEILHFAEAMKMINNHAGKSTDRAVFHKGSVVSPTVSGNDEETIYHLSVFPKNPKYIISVHSLSSEGAYVTVPSMTFNDNPSMAQAEVILAQAASLAASLR